MAQEYLPAPSNVRLADLMKKHNISQPELAKEIGCSKSTIRDRKSTRLNSSHLARSRMPSSA